MANSITPSGTSRNVFDISLSDFETAGTVTAAGFIGSGANLTNININNTEYVLELSKGGTGNYIYNNDGGLIYYNKSSSRFTNDHRLTWDKTEQILKINNRDFLSDTSNYVKSTSNELISILNTTTNILYENNSLNINNITNINNVSNYVLSTSNILIKYINSQQVNNNSNVIATKNRVGNVQIGDGIYVSKNGVISTTESIINTTFPTFVDTSVEFTTIEGLNYKVCKLLYNPSIGTTFDRTNNQTNILPIWCNFSSNNFIGNSTPPKILNIGYSKNSLTKLELYGNVNIKPNIHELNIEYTPVNTTYLEFNNLINVVGNPTYCRFENEFDIDNIYKTSVNNVITISFWLKVNFNNNEITIIEFSNTPTNNDYIVRKLNINYVNNSLIFFIPSDVNPSVSIINIQNIYKNRWYHIIWSIEKQFESFKVQVNINGILEKSVIISNQNYLTIYSIGFKGFDNKFDKNYLSSPNNNSIYKFCISDFKIYSCLLSNEQKSELYNTNNYTKYIIEFKDDETICDILAYGGGGGGSSNYGGGAGKLVYINDAYIPSGRKTINIGRGGSGYYSNINNNQVSLKGNNTTFEYLIAHGGGAITNNLDSNNNYSTINTNTKGGCGSGNYGEATEFNITTDLSNFLGNTKNIYSYGFPGGVYGGGGIGYAINLNDPNPGEGLYSLENNFVNRNTDTTKYFNYKLPINFKNDFGLNNNEIGELYNGNVYIGSGGYGLINDGRQINRGYNSSNSGCGGNLGENGKNGALLIRVLTTIDRNIIPQNVKDTSNYIKTSCNILVTRANLNDSNSSNYVLSTSNILVTRAVLNDKNSSNYVLSTSNILVTKAVLNDKNSSNYVLSTSNILITKADLNDSNSSNYVLSTSNILVTRADLNDKNSSNYVLSTSNIILKIINDLTTDMIQNTGSHNKFIVDNIYNNDIRVNGNLTIRDNLILSGNYLELDTIVYTTETLVVINENVNLVAVTVQQKTGNSDIFIASNQNTKVFAIANNGDVNIIGNYKRNNRDVILDTSNYVLSTSNILIAKANINDKNSSNYIASTSNNIIDYINSINPSAIWNKDAANNINFQYNVGIGVEPPVNYKLEIAQANVTIALDTGLYGIHTSNNSNIILTDSIGNNNICAKFNSSIWATGNIIASSDERIKNNINDISDDSALKMILNIQPKTYNYIDKLSRGNNRIYGFIAQQIKEVIPDAVKIESEFIPNIFSVANYNIYDNIIILQNDSINIENVIKIGSIVKCYDINDKIIVVEVEKIINANTFKIKDINYLNDKIFVYGAEVNDFHVLNKEYINTLNVCAVQELYRKIESQKNEINSLNEKVNDIINFIDISK